MKFINMIRCKDFWKVDLLLLPVKMHYFLFFGGLACILPFRTVFAKQLGVSATAIGIIFFAVPFTKIVTNPLFGLIMDYFKRFRLILSVIIVVVGISHLVMIFIPPKSNMAKKECLQNILHFTVDYNCSKKATSFDFESHYRKMHGMLQTTSSDILKFNCILHCEVSSTVAKNVPKQQKLTYIENCSKNETWEATVKVKLDVSNSDVLVPNETFSKITNIPEDRTAWIDTNKISVTSINRNCAYSIQKKRTKECDIKKRNNLEYALNNSAYQLSHDEKYKCQYVTYFFRNFRTKGQENNYCPCAASFSCISKQCHSETDDTILHDENEFQSFQFWSLFTTIAISSVALCAVIFLMDAVCYEMLDNNKAKFGEQRLWGTIGWGLGALVGGYINQIVSTSSTEIDYSASFYLFAALMIADLIPIYKLRVYNVKYSSNICKDVCLLLSKLHVVINIFTVFNIGVMSGLIWNYQFWFMEEIGSSQLLLGLSQAFECLLAEVPCFILSGWFIRKFGHDNCNSIALLCLGLRFLGFFYMYNPWMTLPISLLHGPTYGIFFASMTMYAKTKAPPGTEATVQALMSMSFEGVGAGIGSILGGIGFDAFGSRRTFLYFAIYSFITLALNICLQFTILRNRKSKEVQKPL